MGSGKVSKEFSDKKQKVFFSRKLKEEEGSKAAGEGGQSLVDLSHGALTRGISFYPIVQYFQHGALARGFSIFSILQYTISDTSE